MKYTVENVCDLLVSSKLLTAEEVKLVSQRWQGEAKESAADAVQFTHWLVAKQYVTEYQAALIAKGYTEGFFIHHYKILQRLGKTRLARVYKAIHQLGQVVAIKVLSPSRGKHPQILARFQREAKLAMRLRHPNVVRTYQVGQYRGLNFLVMEYLEGETLDSVLQRRKKLPVNEAVRLIHQALQGLQHIDDRGLVHRDLKPANLLLTSPTKTDSDTTLQTTVKILDIGLGRELNDRDDPGDALTAEGVLLGTPDYLAPEQARDPRAADIRSDIYSLGCVLYHIITGQPPFPDTNILTQMVRHATETPKPLKDLAPGIPDALQQVVNVMLAKDPARRFATPEQADKALSQFLGDAAPAQTPEEGPQLKKFLTWLEMNIDSRGAAPPAAERVVPPAKPGPVPPAPGAREFDVELLSALPETAQVQGSLPTTNRDWYFLALGAGGVIAAGAIGFLLAWSVRG